jgi:predicted HD superfamily hydrolase involved in NAD metabolism
MGPKSYGEVLMRNWATAKGLDEITTAVRQRLSQSRVLHTLGSCHQGVALACRWNVNPDHALVACLLHDIAKEESKSDQRRRIERVGIEFTDDDLEHKPLWHALAAEAVAREEFGIDAEEICRAIRLHPTGDGEMGPLDRIVFLADYIEPSRHWENFEALRRLARQDLVAAADEATIQKTTHVREKKGRALHMRSRRALEAALARRNAANPSAATCATSPR